MSILTLLASVQGLKENDADIALARLISMTGNKNAVKELVGNLEFKADCDKFI